MIDASSLIHTAITANLEGARPQPQRCTSTHTRTNMLGGRVGGRGRGGGGGRHGCVCGHTTLQMMFPFAHHLDLSGNTVPPSPLPVCALFSL